MTDTPEVEQAQEAVTPSVVYVSFSAEVNANTTESLIAAMANIANQGVPEVHLLMSTPGGFVMNGLNVYNVLRALPITLITHNVGNVDSIGNAIFLAGKQRYACPHSTFMFHGVGFTADGMQFDAKSLRERVDSIDADEKRIAGIIEERTTLTTIQIEPLFREMQTKDATYAVSAGIVHEIKEVSIPPGAPVIALVFQR